MKLKLDFPEKKHKEMYNKIIKEWSETEDISKTSPGALFKGNNYDDFLDITKKDVINSQGGVNAHLFFLVGNDEIMGAIQVRHHIEHPNLIENGGHIGYGISPKFRKKGYATKMLELGLIETRKLGLKRVLLTCDIDNIGSKKVIEKNGGVFERLTKDGTRRKYWIKLD